MLTLSQHRAGFLIDLILNQFSQEETLQQEKFSMSLGGEGSACW